MPITWVTPTSGDPFGPGFVVSGTTDVAGPFETDSFWELELTAPANENIVGTMTFPYLTSEFGVLAWWNGTDLLMSSIHPFAPMVSGAPAQLRVSLVQPTLGVADTDTMPVVMDWVTGQTEVLKQFLRQIGSTAGRGLTEDEHNAVLQTNVGVLAMATISPLDLVGDLAAALSSSPPLGFGSLSATYTLNGDGEMPDVGDLLHTKLGIYFVASAIPAGLSHRHGQSEEYPVRLVQWRTVHTVGGVDMATEVMDFTTHGELLRWSHGKPVRIEYSVTPGVTILARWWQFP